MKLINKHFMTKDSNVINYYETNNDNPILLIIHAQGTNAMSYLKVIKNLSKNFHLLLIDCYGHGKSSHNKAKYHLMAQGNDLIEFIRTTTNGNISVLGHSSGGLIVICRLYVTLVILHTSNIKKNNNLEGIYGKKI